MIQAMLGYVWLFASASSGDIAGCVSARLSQEPVTNAPKVPTRTVGGIVDRALRRADADITTVARTLGSITDLRVDRKPGFVFYDRFRVLKEVNEKLFKGLSVSGQKMADAFRARRSALILENLESLLSQNNVGLPSSTAELISQGILVSARNERGKVFSLEFQSRDPVILEKLKVILDQAEVLARRKFKNEFQEDWDWILQGNRGFLDDPENYFSAGIGQSNLAARVRSRLNGKISSPSQSDDEVVQAALKKGDELESKLGKFLSDGAPPLEIISFFRKAQDVKGFQEYLSRFNAIAKKVYGEPLTETQMRDLRSFYEARSTLFPDPRQGSELDYGDSKTVQIVVGDHRGLGDEDARSLMRAISSRRTANDPGYLESAMEGASAEVTVAKGTRNEVFKEAFGAKEVSISGDTIVAHYDVQGTKITDFSQRVQRDASSSGDRRMRIGLIEREDGKPIDLSKARTLEEKAHGIEKDLQAALELNGIRSQGIGIHLLIGSRGEITAVPTVILSDAQQKQKAKAVVRAELRALAKKHGTNLIQFFRILPQLKIPRPQSLRLIIDGDFKKADFSILIKRRASLFGRYRNKINNHA